MPSEPRRVALLGVVRFGARAVVRQIATAVYVSVAFAFLSGWTRDQPLLSLGAQLALTGLAGALLAGAVEGSWRSTGLVGFFVGFLDLLLAFLTRPPGDEALPWWGSQALQWGLLTLAGAGGAWLVRRRRVAQASVPGDPE